MELNSQPNTAIKRRAQQMARIVNPSTCEFASQSCESVLVSNGKIPVFGRDYRQLHRYRQWHSSSQGRVRQHRKHSERFNRIACHQDISFATPAVRPPVVTAQYKITGTWPEPAANTSSDKIAPRRSATNRIMLSTNADATKLCRNQQKQGHFAHSQRLYSFSACFCKPR